MTLRQRLRNNFRQKTFSRYCGNMHLGRCVCFSTDIINRLFLARRVGFKKQVWTARSQRDSL